MVLKTLNYYYEKKTGNYLAETSISDIIPFHQLYTVYPQQETIFEMPWIMYGTYSQFMLGIHLRLSYNSTSISDLKCVVSRIHNAPGNLNTPDFCIS